MSSAVLSSLDAANPREPVFEHRTSSYRCQPTAESINAANNYVHGRAEPGVIEVDGFGLGRRQTASDHGAARPTSKSGTGHTVNHMTGYP